jgi:glutathione S-transferase
MNLHRHGEPLALSDETQGNVIRILTLWAEARARFGSGGPFLFGSFSAADIAFAPVVTRFRSYAVAVPGFAQAYMDAVWEHAWLQDWASAAAAEAA